MQKYTVRVNYKLQILKTEEKKTGIQQVFRCEKKKMKPDCSADNYIKVSYYILNGVANMYLRKLLDENTKFK